VQCCAVKCSAAQCSKVAHDDGDNSDDVVVVADEDTSSTALHSNALHNDASEGNHVNHDNDDDDDDDGDVDEDHFSTLNLL